MTTRPEVRDASTLVPAIAAVALFVVMAAVFVNSPIGAAEGFPSNAEVANESLGGADVADSASIQTQNGSTVAVVQADGGNESTTLSDDTGVNASIVAAGGQTYGVVSEPVSITENIGYAMFGLTDQISTGLESESFLAVFEIIDVVLVAALVGAVMLARREDASSIVVLFGDEAETSEGDTVAAVDGGVPETDSDADESGAGAVSDQQDGGDA